MTLEMCTEDSRSSIPWGFFCDGRAWRLTMLSRSTTSLCFSGSTLSTLPVLPRSLPAMTLTVSPFFIFRPAAIFLKDLRGQRDHLHEIPVPQLPAHGAEDARTTRVPGGVDEHGGVFVKGDIGAVVAPQLLPRPYHHC